MEPRPPAGEDSAQNGGLRTPPYAGGSDAPDSAISLSRATTRVLTAIAASPRFEQDDNNAAATYLANLTEPQARAGSDDDDGGQNVAEHGTRTQPLLGLLARVALRGGRFEDTEALAQDALHLRDRLVQAQQFGDAARDAGGHGGARDTRTSHDPPNTRHAHDADEGSHDSGESFDDADVPLTDVTTSATKQCADLAAIAGPPARKERHQPKNRQARHRQATRAQRPAQRSGRASPGAPPATPPTSAR